MTELILVSALFGALLGLRFKVYVLVPAIGIVSAFLGVEAIVHGDGFAWTTISMVLAAVCIQLSYVVASALRPVPGPARDRISLPRRWLSSRP